MNKFKIGDRVVVNACDDYPYLNGYCGTIVSFRGNAGYGVEFDEPILALFGSGHSCKGCTKPGHGWFLLERWLELILNSVSLQDVSDLL